MTLIFRSFFVNILVLSLFITNVMGCSEISLMELIRVFELIANRPEPSLSFTSIVVVMIVSLSEAVMLSTLSERSKSTHSSIGSEFLLFCTRLIACSLLHNDVLDTLNFIVLHVLFCLQRYGIVLKRQKKNVILHPEK